MDRISNRDLAFYTEGLKESIQVIIDSDDTRQSKLISLTEIAHKYAAQENKLDPACIESRLTMDFHNAWWEYMTCVVRLIGG